jgi:serine/threonine protein kinase
MSVSGADRDRWKRVEAIFSKALLRAPAERGAFLAAACADDAGLRKEVEALLSSHDAAGGAFERRPPVEPALRDAGVSPAAGAHLGPGQRVGAYEILAVIGAGGMGQVYRARDTKLNRDVALKILPEAVARDADRLARQRREARVLASLNHPNIAQIYGFEDSGTTHALVLELVEGLTLADVLMRRRLSLEEILSVARQMAGALEAAHDAGVIHRDLKPRNVILKDDGTVKVLDFGLAKSVAIDPAEGEDTTSPATTEMGIVLGTAAYMSPEQARGLPVDKRTDIWAFGVVVYELLTGKRMFIGDSATDILAAVVRAEPDWRALPVSTPVSIRRLLQRCVEKDLKKRLPHIGVARLEIDEAIAAPKVLDAPLRTRRRSMIPWLTAGIAIGALALVSWYGLRTPPEIQWTGARLTEASVAWGPRVSPDGRLLAFEVMADGLMQVAVMKPDTSNWTILTHETSRGWVNNISWSTDGAKLFFDRYDGRRWRILSVPLLGGDEQLIVEDAYGPQVLADGSLVVAKWGATLQPQVYRFWPESERLQPLKAWPKFMLNASCFRVTPNGQHLIFFGKLVDDPKGQDYLYVMDITSEKTTRLGQDLSFDVGLSDLFPLSASADSQSVLVRLPAGNLSRLVQVPLDGGHRLQTILVLASNLGGLDAGIDGSLYMDQEDFPIETLRLSIEGGTPERLGPLPYSVGDPHVLPLTDGRLLMNSSVAGRDHLLLKSPNRDPSPLLDTQEETAFPMTLVGDGQVAFLIGSGADRTIGLASLSDRRITRRLEGAKGTEITSMVASPDGKTIYYSGSGSIWSIAVSGGPAKKFHDGLNVTLDSAGRQLVIAIIEQPDGARLVRVPIDGGPDRPIVVHGDAQPIALDLQSNAVDKSGRLLERVSIPNHFFSPLGLIDLNTGRAQVINAGYDADMIGGWAPDGRIILNAMSYRSSVWRFRPQTSAPRK